MGAYIRNNIFVGKWMDYIRGGLIIIIIVIIIIQ